MRRRFEAPDDLGDMIEALQRFQRSSPDVILLDWSPSFPGLEFLKMVRSRKSPNRFVPVILISSYTEPHAVFEARDAGVTSFLAKPVTAQLWTRLLPKRTMSATLMWTASDWSARPWSPARCGPGTMRPRA